MELGLCFSQSWIFNKERCTGEFARKAIDKATRKITIPKAFRVCMGMFSDEVILSCPAVLKVRTNL